jgi:hypothetical protein
MLVTLIGISTEVKPEELKALVPIPVKLSGSLMEAKLEQKAVFANRFTSEIYFLNGRKVVT